MGEASELGFINGSHMGFVWESLGMLLKLCTCKPAMIHKGYIGRIVLVSSSIIAIIEFCNTFVLQF